MPVAANYFDGHSSRVRAVRLSAVGGELRIVGVDFERSIRFSDLHVDERLGHAARRLRLADGAICEVNDLVGLDELLAASGHRDGWVDRLQRHRTAILSCLLVFLMLSAAAYRWGLPWAAEKAAARIPASVARKISTQVIEALDGTYLKNSALDEDRRRKLDSSFRSLLSPELRSQGARLLFRSSPRIGPNAFTLPDGTVVVLDELATLLTDEQLAAVLAHELGHAHERHGLQMLLRSSIVGAFLTFYVGDISQLLTAAPVALIEARYSQEFEREADDEGAALLRAHGLPPTLLADALDRLAKARPDLASGGYLSSHPATATRIARIRNLGIAGRR